MKSNLEKTPQSNNQYKLLLLCIAISLGTGALLASCHKPIKVVKTIYKTKTVVEYRPPRITQMLLDERVFFQDRIRMTCGGDEYVTVKLCESYVEQLNYLDNRLLEYGR